MHGFFFVSKAPPWVEMEEAGSGAESHNIIVSSSSIGGMEKCMY
jgi:hypothetical protein